MVKIRKHLVPDHIAKKYIYGNKNTKKYIIIHETDNTGKGANADAHSRLQYRGNDRQASWHYQVDDKEIVQSFSDDAQCWAASNKYYNENGINIEMCVNRDGDYKKMLDKTVELVKSLMIKYNIPKENVITHQKTSPQNKPCPRNLLSGAKGVTWSQFIAKLDEKPTETKPVDKPKPPTESKPKGDMKTTSIVNYLKSINQPSSFAHRAKLAKQYGIKMYVGTASQNTKLLNLLRKGGTVSKPPTTTKPKTFKVGDKVKIKSSADKYSRTNVTIPARYKNKTMTVQQVGKDDVLIKEVYSWVKKEHIQ